MRMAIHTGESEERNGDYFGPSLSRVRRLLDAGHGGQILVSLAARASLDGAIPEGVEVRDLGERRLKAIPGSEKIFQISAPGLPSSFPPLRTLDPRPGNLPAWPTPLIGREPEVAEVAKRIREGTRLLTLTGSGGTGKTRLALRVAESLTDEFEDGVFLVPLASVGDHRLVAPSIVKALGLDGEGESSPSGRVKEYLRGKETLLVLDNFEHVLDGATLASELLSACPKLKVLATSRSLLHLYGEQEHPVPPLSLPESDAGHSIEELSGCESVRLFVERARDVKFGFALTDGNASDIAEICRRLDRLPLAIELAAARVRMLSPGGVLRRLDDRMKLLAGGARDLPERHQSLRGAIAWSHDLLGKHEKFIFRRLAVFSGGCTPEAARKVCGFEAGTDMYGELRSLEDKSLIHHEETPDGEPRFTMLETIREYASEKLEESAEADESEKSSANGEAEEARLRHAEHFLAFAEAGNVELRGPRQAGWMAALERDHDNVRAALSWSLEEPGRAAIALRISGAMGWFWDIGGHMEEGWRWLRESLEKASDAPDGARAAALNGAGYISMNLGHLDRADSLLEEALDIGRRLGGKSIAATSLMWLGMVALYRGDAPRAEERFAQSLEIFRGAGDEWGCAGAATLLGGVVCERGDSDRGRSLLEEALGIYRGIGDDIGAGAGLNNLGLIALFSGDYEGASSYLEESIVICRRLGNKWYPAAGLCGLGHAKLLAGEPGAAEKFYREAISLCREQKQRMILAECLEGMAASSAERGDALRAATLSGAALALSEAMDYSLDEIRSLLSPFLEKSRARLGEAAWGTAVSEGRSMTLDEAAERATDEEGRRRIVG